MLKISATGSLQCKLASVHCEADHEGGALEHPEVILVTCSKSSQSGQPIRNGVETRIKYVVRAHGCKRSSSHLLLLQARPYPRQTLLHPHFCHGLDVIGITAASKLKRNKKRTTSNTSLQTISSNAIVSQSRRRSSHAEEGSYHFSSLLPHLTLFHDSSCCLSTHFYFLLSIINTLPSTIQHDKHPAQRLTTILTQAVYHGGRQVVILPTTARLTYGHI